LSSRDVLQGSGPKEAAAAAAEARAAMSDDHVKTLNLTHDWFNSLLPQAAGRAVRGERSALPRVRVCAPGLRWSACPCSRTATKGCGGVTLNW